MTPTDWVPVENTESEFAPACGVAKVTGVTADGVLQFELPDADSDGDVLVLSDVTVPPVESSGRGEGTFDNRVVVAYDEADGEPAAGEEWGVKAGEWVLKSGYTGFLILGGAGKGRVNALRRRGAPAAARVYSTTAFTTTSITGAIGVGWTDVTSASRTITEAGLYRIWADGAFLMNISAGAPGIMYAVLRDSGGAVLAGSFPASVEVAGVNVLYGFHLQWLLDLDAGDVPYTFKLSGARNGATWTTSQINSSATTLANEVGYVRVTP